jgi:hypothetical protein
MTQNMGNMDRILRVAIAFVIGVLYFSGTISGTVAIILGVLAVVFVLTSAISFCPLYLPLKLSTKKKS